MRALDKIYYDLTYGRGKWYEVIWYNVAVAAIMLWLTPGALWRNFRRHETESDIEARKYPK